MPYELNISPDRAIEIIRLCQAEADVAIQEGNVPIASIITDLDGTIIVKEHNTQNTDFDPTAHAEIKALRALGRLKKSRYLEGHVIFSNAETCSMCLSGAIKAGIRHFYYGAPAEPSMDPNIPMEYIATKSKHPIHVVGSILDEECAAQIARGRKEIADRLERAKSKA